MASGKGVTYSPSPRSTLRTFIPPPTFVSASESVIPTAALSSGILRWAVKMRGDASASGVLRLGSRRGATSQRNATPTAPAAAAGTMKSNIPMRLSPMSAATDTTSRFVDVPIVVAAPPIRVATPIGIRIFEGLIRVRIETVISTGSSRTTIGVLLTNALSVAAITSVSSIDSTGQVAQSFARTEPSGSSAPVRTRPCPTIMRAQTATSAS